MPAQYGSCWSNERSAQLIDQIWLQQCQFPWGVVWWKDGEHWGQTGLYPCLNSATYQLVDAKHKGAPHASSLSPSFMAPW